jgi:hypothetical protein
MWPEVFSKEHGRGRKIRFYYFASLKTCKHVWYFKSVGIEPRLFELKCSTARALSEALKLSKPGKKTEKKLCSKYGILFVFRDLSIVLKPMLGLEKE